VGRSDEQSLLLAALSGAGPSTALIEGGPGSGRTALVRWLAAAATAQGLEVLDLTNDGVTAGDLQARLDGAAGVSRRLVVLADDADRLDARLVTILAANAISPPWVLLVASCTTPPGRGQNGVLAPLRRCIDEGTGRRLLLRHLDVDDSIAMLEQRAGTALRLSPALVEHLVRSANGTPGVLAALADELAPRHRTRYDRVRLEQALRSVRIPTGDFRPTTGTDGASRRDQPRECRITVLRGWSVLESGSPSSALHLAGEALAAAATIRDAGAAAHAQALAAVAVAELGDAPQVERHIERAEAAMSGRRVPDVMPALAQALLLAGDADGATTRALAGMRSLDGQPPGPAHMRAALTLAWCRWRTGELEECTALLAACADIDRVLPAAAPYRLGLEALVAADRADQPAIRRVVGALLALDRQALGLRPAAWSAWAAGRALANSGSPDAAARWLSWAVRAQAGCRSVAGETAMLPDVVETELVRGQVGNATAAVERLDALTAGTTAPLTVELRARSRALVCMALRDTAGGLHAAEQAIAQRLVSPLERVRSLRVLSVASDANGRPTAAASALAEARQLAHACGALAELARIERSLARGRPASREALSERELEVCALVAEGLTNRTIAARLSISHRTVDHHVGRILQKLRLDNRTQLASWVVQPDHRHSAATASTRTGPGTELTVHRPLSMMAAP